MTLSPPTATSKLTASIATMSEHVPVIIRRGTKSWAIGCTISKRLSRYPSHQQIPHGRTLPGGCEQSPTTFSHFWKADARAQRQSALQKVGSGAARALPATITSPHRRVSALVSNWWSLNWAEPTISARLPPVSPPQKARPLSVSRWGATPGRAAFVRRRPTSFQIRTFRKNRVAKLRQLQNEGIHEFRILRRQKIQCFDTDALYIIKAQNPRQAATEGIEEMMIKIMLAILILLSGYRVTFAEGAPGEK